MSKLKVFEVNYDGRQSRMVSSPNQKDAAERMGVPVSRLREYGREVTSAEQMDLALKHPGLVMTRPIWKKDGEWRPLNGY